MTKTLFEKIIDEEIPSVKIYEDEICIAIMDKFPSTKGQSLVIPKNPISYIFDNPDETYTHIFLVAKNIAQATDKALEPLRTCIVVEGFEVPHTHIKLLPAYEEHLPIGEQKEASNEELEEISREIKNALRLSTQ